MPIRHEPILMIDSALIAQNIREVRLNTSKQIIGVLKCEGYGLGLERAHRILNRLGVNFFAVATTDEALRLRSITPDTILLLTPVFDIDSVEQLTKSRASFKQLPTSPNTTYTVGQPPSSLSNRMFTSRLTQDLGVTARNNELPSVAKWSSVCDNAWMFCSFQRKLKIKKTDGSLSKSSNVASQWKPQRFDDTF